ncbi:citramalate synthase [bacterium]|nr:citramalate synthase [bacterium]
MNKIEIYDTTLRDGAQSEGINFSTSDKLKIIKLLDSLGIDYIEAGWPGANPKDEEVFKDLKNIKLKNAKITAFGCTRKANTKPENDKVLEMLLNADTEIITIFGKTWDFHVEHALCTTLDENLLMISDSIKYLISKGKRVFFDAEHFFDGYKNDEKYAIKAIKTAYNAGAKRIILCDTNGGCMSYEISEITNNVSKLISGIKLGIHAHNDSEMAVANSIAAVDSGAVQVQGTINGYGERCGNANLCSIIPNLQIKKNYEVVGEKIHDLTFIANNIAEIANVVVPSNLPYVGMSAFAHKAGIHASGVRKNSQTYEHISPDEVGNRRKILISDQAGTASIREKMQNLRIVKDVKEEDLSKIIERINKLEWKGFAFEGAEASFELLILDTLNGLPDFFQVSGFRVIGDTFIGEKNHNIITEASVKVKIDDYNIHTVAEGQGPVNALDTALRKALVEFYPEILKYKLCDFKVRILDSKDGTAAITRVTVETTDGINKWDTVGVSEDIIEASYMAITDSIMYGLILHNPNI